MTPLLLLRVSLMLLASPSLSLSTEVARAKLRKTRQWTNNFRNYLGDQLVLQVKSLQDAPHTIDENNSPTATAQVKKTSARVPPVQALLLDDILSTADEAIPAEKSTGAWLAQFARTRELSISTSPFMDDSGSDTRTPSPIMRAGHAKATTDTAAAAEAVSADDPTSAWLAQFERTKELTISTSPFIDASRSVERTSSPIKRAGHAKDAYARTLQA